MIWINPPRYSGQVNVELPFPGEIQNSREIDTMFREKLLLQWNVYATHFHHNGKWWIRCSTQIWNEVRLSAGG